MSSVALVVIYNHQYNKNIDVIERIYSSRFEKIFHLVPFYHGDKSNVIPVYESSFYFEGYVSQGFAHFAEVDVTHFLFIADDLILNPAIDQNNYARHLKCDADSSFLPQFIQLHETRKWWPRCREAVRWTPKAVGVEGVSAMLPSYDEALAAFGRFGLTIKPLTFYQTWGFPTSLRGLARLALHDPRAFIRIFVDGRKEYCPRYPFVGGHADIFLLSAKAARQFAQYCGIFAATDLFVELAIPTAMVLTAEKIVTEKDLDLKGAAVWTKEETVAIEHRYDRTLARLLADFPAGNLYLHPVKLSRWNTGP